MSRRDDRRQWGHNAEGRAHARERRRQEAARAELDRSVRERGAEAEDVPVADGDRVRPVPGPSRLGGVLGDLVRERGWDDQLRAARLHEAWPAIVGEHLADRCRPGRLRGGVLQVVVATPHWATQLQYMTDQLVGRVVAETGLPVREVRVVVGDLGD